MQDKCSLQQLGIDAPRSNSVSIDMPERNSTSGFGVEPRCGSSASAIPRKRRRRKDERRARRKRKKRGKRSISQSLARENATIGWLEGGQSRVRPNVHTRDRWVCKSAPLRVQGHVRQIGWSCLPRDDRLERGLARADACVKATYVRRIARRTRSL